MSGRSSPLAPRERSAVLRRAFVDSLPVLMGYTTMGFVAGALLAAKSGIGHAPFWGFLSSLSCVSGTFSFAMVQPVAERAPAWTFALLAAGLNFRYAFYGFTMLGRWKDVPLLKKLFLVHMLSDENYALEAACRYARPSAHLLYCMALSAMNLVYWVAGVTAGALAVAILQGALDPDLIRARTNGMEFAMVALFLVIFTDQAKEMARHGK